MCLAKAYVRPVNDCPLPASVTPGGTEGTFLLMENVTRLEIDGDDLTVRSLLGATQSLHARVASIDFAEGKLVLQCLEPATVMEARNV
jgi:predicted RNA-binding protein